MALARLWLVSPDPAAQPWERLLRRQGWTVRLLPGPAALARLRPADLSGLAIVDWSCLRPDPGARLAGLKTAAPRLSVIGAFRVAASSDEIAAALDAGADDHFYYSMPPQLFLAKVKTHLRRLLPSLNSLAAVLRSPSGDLRLDRDRIRVERRDADRRWVEIEGLTRTEFEIVALFLQSPQAPLERRQIVEALRPGQPQHIRASTVDKHVESLRRKLGPLGERIRTLYGVGYAYKEPRS